MQIIHRFVRYQERVSGVPGRFIAPVVLAGHLAAGRRPRDVLGHRRTTSITAAIRACSPRRTCSSSRACRASSSPRCCTAGCAGREARNERRAAAAPEHEPGRDRDARLRRRRAARLPAGRLLARALRRGRDALGPHAPVHDRGRRREHARRVDGHAPGLRARAPAQARPPRPAARGRRADHRPVDLPGRVRLRRPAVPAALPAGAHRLRRRRRARVRALDPRALGRLPGAGDVLRHPRRAGAVRRPGRRATRRRTSRSTSPRRLSSRLRGARRAARAAALRAAQRRWASGPSASRPSGPGATSGCPIRGPRRCSRRPSSSPWPPRWPAACSARA